MKKASVTVGPFAVFFTNVNTAMNLPGHSHFGTVTLCYSTRDKIGFPAFGDTYADIQAELVTLLEKPLRGMSNEDVADYLFKHFLSYKGPAEISRDCAGMRYRLVRLDLAVRGVPDRIGHADGFTTYTVEETA